MADPGRLTDLAASVTDRAHILDESIVVGLSGGADSAVCAWVLGELGADVRCVHIDHGWQHSAMLAGAAIQVADHLDVRLETRRVDAPATEGGAREMRYHELSAALGDDEVLATGHTADDEAETVLAAILRGTGPEGLSGIPRARPGVVRPIIDVWRVETRELATLLGLPFADDPTNNEPGVRNDIRNQLIPQLEKSYNPRVRHALVRMAGLVADEHRFVEGHSRAVPVRVEEGRVTIPLSSLRVVDRAVATNVIRAACRRLNPPYAPDAESIERVLDVVAGNSAGAQTGGGINVRAEGPLLALTCERPTRRPV